MTKMKTFILFVVLLIFALIQSSVFGINLIFLFSLGFFILGNEKLALMSLFYGGLLLDFLGTERFGIYALCMSLTALFILIVRKFLGSNVFLLPILCAVSFLLFNFLVNFPRLNIPDPYFLVPLNLAFFFALLPFCSWFNGIFKKDDSVSRN